MVQRTHQGQPASEGGGVVHSRKSQEEKERWTERKGGFAKRGEMVLETRVRARRLHPVVCQNHPETASFPPRASLFPEDHGHFVHKKFLEASLLW